MISFVFSSPRTAKAATATSAVIIGTSIIIKYEVSAAGQFPERARFASDFIIFSAFIVLPLLCYRISRTAQPPQTIISYIASRHILK